MDNKQLMQSIISYRKQNNIFQKSIDQRSKDLQVVTYDGPPFASGTPHYGHGLVSVMKDTIARFKTMQGYRVERKRGRDCHGLPVEKFVEKQLGIDGKRDIEKMGIENFIEACRSSVRNVNSERKTFVDNIGRRSDMDNAYFTMDLDFMESVIRVFGKMYDQNLVYKGFAIQGYCPSCATALSNSEINDGYKDRQDPAITVKFQIIGEGKKGFDSTNDGFTRYVQAVIQNEQGHILSLFNKKHNRRQFPGGKIDQGETPEQALHREIQAQLGVQGNIGKYLGSKKILIQGDPCNNIDLYEVSIQDQASIQDTNKHGYLQYIEIIPWENREGYAYKVQDNIISDDEEVIQYNDLCTYQQLQQEYKLDASVYFLARTTTPRTLPSNMFLAVGEKVEYLQVFDISKQEYYVIAQDLIPQYYKNNDEYIIIQTFTGDKVVGLHYKPLFDYYHQDPHIQDTYKQQVHKIIPGDFVTTDNGTGIVHIAPAFGQDDFEAVAKFFPKDDAKNRLFMPINEYGEFTEQVEQRQGIRAYEANKDIIQTLKEQNKVIKNKTYDHSYPHCRRCETPLIYKAMTSRFIKEQDIAQQTIPAIDEIKFVPETTKNRFRDVLKSAPDRNISRNRYWGAPIPVWESTQDPNQRIVINTLDDLYHYTKTGSANLTKHCLVRHAHTDYNQNNTHDNLGTAELDTLGHKQTATIARHLEELVHTQDDFVIVVSPLPRTRYSIVPWLKIRFSEQEVQKRQEKYNAIVEQYQVLRQQGKIIQYIHDEQSQKQFVIDEKIIVDFRITDLLIPDYQNHADKNEYKAQMTYNDQQLSAKGESLVQVKNRLQRYFTDINTTHKTKTIITISHETCIVFLKQLVRDFDFDTQREKYLPTNAQITTYYRDTDRQSEIDLHKPYVDNYRFTRNNHTFRRIPEVLDCWFESGSMPYGQMHYLEEKSQDLQYPADFIIEGLDQTRGRFRTLHVLGQGITHKNAFNNVIINGLILAEDGKKMSKKFKNYPDPQAVFDKYGADPLRICLLSSPAVRAEPMRLGESAIEQVYKDFSAPLFNAYNFFATYAQIDGFKTQGNKVYLIHDANNIQQAEEVIRLQADCIVYTDIKSLDTAEKIQNMYKHICNKRIEMIHDSEKDYKKILEKYTTKNLIIITDREHMQTIRNTHYNALSKINPSQKIIQVPHYMLNNDIDRRITAELHNLIKTVEEFMNDYELDIATKEIINFIEKLTNRYIRRSRRRFRASGMTADKESAYNTLFMVLQNIVQMSAAFAPFTTEKIRQDLQKFNKKNEAESVHLSYLPVANQQYIDQELLQDIKTVRRIISQGLYIRSKNSIKIKQPLQTISIHRE